MMVGRVGGQRRSGEAGFGEIVKAGLAESWGRRPASRWKRVNRIPVAALGHFGVLLWSYWRLFCFATASRGSGGGVKVVGPIAALG